MADRVHHMKYESMRHSMHTFIRDVGYTLRQLRRSPGFALITILTLTMAIAA